MATEVKTPDLGDGIDSGDVLEILVNVGDSINKGDGIIELETDKATVTVPSDASGVVTKILVEEGDTATIGTALIELEAKDSAAPAPQMEQPTEPSQTAAAPPAETPPPATPPLAAAAPVRATPDPAPAATVAETPSTESPETTSGGSVVAAGPAIRRFAREVGVDLGIVSGSGQDGRITRDDVLAVVRGKSANHGQAAQANGEPPAGETDGYGPVTYQKMSRMRKTIAEQMHKSWTTVPRVTNFDDADITDLEEFRQSSKADYAAQGIKLTTMPFLIKSIAMALKMHPEINASVDMEKGQICLKNYVNIGIAVDTDRGLVVPSLRNADKMSIPDVARALGKIAESSRTGDFSVEDLRGSTFTISNLGAIGGTYSTPIINVPEAAILLVGRSRKLPVVVGDEIVPRLMMPMSLSYDHRLIDGAAAARFLNEIIAYLNAPSRILLAP
ncbi:MAG: 2-oxo acid dehydrogenase subunit E2 [Pirellulaceae bacterium]|nr:2-oxo acid dehydrogenase subunit E2 [Pirellulaceae bacterium]